jgi:hypothetical protein
MKLVTGQGSDGQRGGDDSGDLIPEGTVVEGRLSMVELHEFTWNDEQVKKLRWHFTLTQPPYSGREITGDTSLTFTPNPNCKAYNWAAALLQREPAAGEEIDTDEMIGLAGQLLVGHRNAKDGRVWLKIKEVFAAGKGAQAMVPAGASAEDDDAPF